MTNMQMKIVIDIWVVEGTKKCPEIRQWLCK
jgi:hypothetical protein